MYNEKEFKAFLDVYSEVELSTDEKTKLKQLGKTLWTKVLHKLKNHITNRAVCGWIDLEQAKWAIYTIWYLKWIFK